MDFDNDVLIVGAGPTGLALANALHRLGTSCTLIEARESTSIHTKATNLMPGTLEQLDVFGLTDRMYEAGGVMLRYMIHMYGSNVGPREMHLNESPHPNVIFLGQDRIDRNLREYLPDRGADVLFGHRLASLSQDERGVTALIEHSGETKRTRFKYVVGCDGPRSTVRRFSDCDFEPVKTGKYVWQVDAKLQWTGLRTMKQMWLYYYPEGFGAVIHLPNDVTKVMVFEEKGRLPEREPTLHEMQDRLREMSGDPTATLTDETWVSHGELLTGVAPSMVDGRVILAGDACNPILPNGGQGLNVGIQDALNLAWKLHDTVRGKATPALLKTYDAERRANRLALEKVQINTLKFTLPAPTLNRLILRRYGNWIMDRIWPKLAKAFSQLGLAYNRSPLTLETLGRKGVRAGERVADADVQRGTDREEVSLFRELCVPRWKVIFFDAGREGSSPAVFDHPILQSCLKFIVSSAPASHYRAANLFHDLDSVAHKRYGFVQPTLLLVRPDNYIAVRCSPESPEHVLNYFAQWYPDVLKESAERTA